MTKKTGEVFRAARQGEVYARRIDALPMGLVQVKPDGEVYIIGHSETGHHHVMDRQHVEMYRLPDSITECFLVVKEPTPLRHLRQHDTHAPILYAPGTYKVSRRRERAHTPEGFQVVQD